MRIGVFITVRLGSSRLPNKALLEIKGKPIIEHLINWIKRANGIDEIVLCTTSKPEDYELVKIAVKNDIKFFQGSENDILKRQLDAANRFDIDFIINTEGDGIFYDKKYIEDMVDLVKRNNCLYDVLLTKELPLGVNLYGYKKEALEKIMNKSVETGWLELLATDRSLNQGILAIDPRHKINARLTLDYVEDYDLFKMIYEQFNHFNFDLVDIVGILKKKPELLSLNNYIDEEYWNRFNKQKLRVLIIGLGSMGKRRIRNLKALGLKNIYGFDIREDRRSEVKDIETFSSLDEAMKKEPNCLIISVPPKNHLEYQLFAIEHNVPFFTEASVISQGLGAVVEEVQEKKLVGVPSCTMRFHPAIQKIKKHIDKIGKPITFSYRSSSYLPEWHIWDDPKTYYAYDKEQGAAKEIVPFELSWLTWIFGNIVKVRSMVKESCKWGIDDLYQCLIEFKNGCIGHLQVDVISRKMYRDIRITGMEGIIEWDWNDVGADMQGNKFGYVWIHKPNEPSVGIKIELSQAEKGYNSNIIEQMYIDEMDAFLNAVSGIKEFGYTLEDDLEVLRWLNNIDRND